MSGIESPEKSRKIGRKLFASVFALLTITALAQFFVIAEEVEAGTITSLRYRTDPGRGVRNAKVEWIMDYQPNDDSRRESRHIWEMKGYDFQSWKHGDCLEGDIVFVKRVLGWDIVTTCKHTENSIPGSNLTDHQRETEGFTD